MLEIALMIVGGQIIALAIIEIRSRRERARVQKILDSTESRFVNSAEFDMMMSERMKAHAEILRKGYVPNGMTQDEYAAWQAKSLEGVNCCDAD